MEGLYKEKGSKFYAFLHPVATEDQAKELLREYKKKYFDARHHCYALILGPDMAYQKYSDDGEPAHTAGTPILNRLRSAMLTDVVCIVVRFFGGTKLGVPGLIDAYKSATEAAIAQAQILEKEVMEEVNLSSDYMRVNEVMRVLKSFNALLINQEYLDTQIHFKVGIPLGQKEDFIHIVLKNHNINLL